MSAEEATINPDGSTTIGGEEIPLNEENPGEEAFGSQEEAFQDDIPPVEDLPPGIDPAFYLIGAVLLIGVLYYFFVYRKKDADEEDEFFTNVDMEKFNLKLPDEVEQYYEIKARCKKGGWKPGSVPQGKGQPGSPHAMLAQALMKRAMAGIPLVTMIQKESVGMNKLYAASMCSVKQWQAYQAAEAMVSAEVEEVRAEADEIEPNWSQMIWRQAMQYHQMLQQKHEQERKAVEEQEKKRQEIAERVRLAKEAQLKDPVEEAEQAAQELLKEEEKTQGGGSKGSPKKKGKKK